MTVLNISYVQGCWSDQCSNIPSLHKEITPSTTGISITYRGQRNSLRDPHRCVPEQLMQNNMDGQTKQCQSERCKVKQQQQCRCWSAPENTGAVLLDLDLLCLQWGPPSGLFSPENDKISLYLGNVPAFHLQHTYHLKAETEWKPSEGFCHCCFVKSKRNQQMGNSILIDIVSTFSTMDPVLFLFLTGVWYFVLIHCYFSIRIKNKIQTGWDQINLFHFTTVNCEIQWNLLCSNSIYSANGWHFICKTAYMIIQESLD